MRYFFSIVITTYNRKALLRKCLESLAVQRFDLAQCEVCIVDDGSTDGTADLMNEIQVPFRCSVISLPNGGPSNARNTGARSVSGTFIVFLEDDVIVHDDWLMNAFSILQADDVDVLEGRTIYQETKKDVRRFDNDEYLSFIPCNLFVRREIFLKTGGYDTQFNSVEDNLYFRDDTELGFRLLDLKVRVKKSGGLIVEHPEQFSDIKRCLRHAMRYQFDPLFYKKHPVRFRSDIDVKRIFGVTLHRPHHYAYLGSVLLSILLFLSLVGFVGIDPLVLFIPVTLLSFLVRIKYQGKDAWKLYKIADTLGFFILPFVYVYALLKGSIRYRSLGALY